MKGKWLNIEDTIPAVGGAASSLFADKGKWIGFIHETELSCGVFCRRRIDKDTASQKIAVEIGDKRSNVASAVRTVCCRVFLFDIVEIFLGTLVELRVRAFVDRVIFTACLLYTSDAADE